MPDKAIQGFENISVPVKLLTAGTSACFADFASFPLDTAKVRLQIQGQVGMAVRTLRIHTGELLHFGKGDPVHYKGILGTVGTIAREEGVRGLYSGLNAGLQRQMCFASVRLGMYEPVKTKYQQILKVSESGKGGLLDVGARIMAGLTTGAMAVMVAQPTDVVKVRMQAQLMNDVQLTPHKIYTGTWMAYRTIFTSEGIKGLWRGALPNMGRNAIVNVAEIVCYDLVKENIIKYGIFEDNIPCHFSSAVIAGLCATLCASPVDVIKTRYMNSEPGTYKGAIDCGLQTIRKEGASAFYKGFWPSFSRLVSWNIIMWLSYEQLKRVVVINYRDQE